MDRCQNFRDRWLERALDSVACETLERSDEHMQSCSTCSEWARATRYQVGALQRMPRLELPDSLADGVQDDLQNVSGRIERALFAMAPVPAPAKLDRLVAASFERDRQSEAPSETENAGDGITAPTNSDDDSQRASVGVVRALDYTTVPPVLERLLEEELADPDGHLAQRFVGNLERQDAPDELEARVARTLGRPVFGRFVALATLAAASLVLWLVLRPSEEPTRRKLHVVRADSLAQLDPVARGLIEALGGGARSVMMRDSGAETAGEEY